MPSFTVQYEDFKGVFSTSVPMESLRCFHMKSEIFDRWGVNPGDQRLEVEGLFGVIVLGDISLLDNEYVDPDNINIILRIAEGVTPPTRSVLAEGITQPEEVIHSIVIVKAVGDIVSNLPLPPLVSLIDHTLSFGGTSATSFPAVVDTVFTNTTAAQYSEVVTSVRGSVLVSDKTTTTSHVVYPFVFRAGGKDMRAMWAAELRERLAASVHPVTLGRDVYHSALKLLDDSPSPSPSDVTWELIVSISCRPTMS